MLEHFVMWWFTAILMALVINIILDFEYPMLSIVLAGIVAAGIKPTVDSVYKEVHQSVVIVSGETGVGVEGRFSFMSGYVDNKIYYRLRKKISSTEYRDFLVSNTVLQEKDTLVDKGFYDAKYRCLVRNVSKYLWMEKVKDYPVDFTSPRCQQLSSSITVPKGSLVKEIQL